MNKNMNMSHEGKTLFIFLIRVTFFLVISIAIMSCTSSKAIQKGNVDHSSDNTLAQPYETKSSMNFSVVIGWEDLEKPVAPSGFNVTKYADSFENPRWMVTTPNGDILVAEANTYHPPLEKFLGTIVGANKSNSFNESADRITLLRDTDGDGFPDIRNIFLSD
ncbi:MAG: hypothetical protein PF693_00995 [Spirochaetia bacterium]|jgi:glucose/arabinose dehydrogenase|nr:hypothetical protein [Spirochaetia bacterium]